MGMIALYTADTGMFIGLPFRFDQDLGSLSVGFERLKRGDHTAVAVHLYRRACLVRATFLP